MKDPLKQGLKQHWKKYKHMKKISWSERSIKTRIETILSIICGVIMYGVEVKDPLKQGLKPYKGIELKVIDFSGWSERSIKTRIETMLYIRSKNVGKRSWSERSIKTRIETGSWFNWQSLKLRVEVKDPLKQGLKPNYFL